MVLGLGTAWILDGLSVTIASSVTSKLTQPGTLHLTTTEAASIGTVYLVGEVIGALVFGRLSDQLGRRKLFMWTLAIYLVGTGLTAFTPKGTSWIFYLYATRIIAGMGIGGEYSAVNSAIDEMMPARYRGRTGRMDQRHLLAPARSSARSRRSCCSARCERAKAGAFASWLARPWRS